MDEDEAEFVKRAPLQQMATACDGAGENLRTLLAPDSPLRNDLDLALQQLASTAQSISALVDFLKRNPNALIVGREILPKKP